MKALLLIFVLWFSSQSFAAPAQVIIIRHAEKEKNGNDLSSQGYKRADALVKMFKSDPRALKFGEPVAIYAMEPKGSGSKGETSLRAIETVNPVAQALNLPIHETYEKSDYEALAKEVLSRPEYDGKMVLVCWEHKKIPLMAAALGAKTAPAEWDKGAYDRLWILNFNGGRVSFSDLPQRLLPGDSNN